MSSRVQILVLTLVLSVLKSHASFEEERWPPRIQPVDPVSRLSKFCYDFTSCVVFMLSFSHRYKVYFLFIAKLDKCLVCPLRRLQIWPLNISCQNSRCQHKPFMFTSRICYYSFPKLVPSPKFKNPKLRNPNRKLIIQNSRDKTCPGQIVLHPHIKVLPVTGEHM